MLKDNERTVGIASMLLFHPDNGDCPDGGRKITRKIIVTNLTTGEDIIFNQCCEKRLLSGSHQTCNQRLSCLKYAYTGEAIVIGNGHYKREKKP